MAFCFFESCDILIISTTIVSDRIYKVLIIHLALFGVPSTSSNDDCLAPFNFPAPISGHPVPSLQTTTPKWLPLLQQRRKQGLARRVKAPITCQTATLICPALHLRPLGKGSLRIGSTSCLCSSLPSLLLAPASTASITQTKSSLTRSTLEKYSPSRHRPLMESEVY